LSSSVGMSLNCIISSFCEGISSYFKCTDTYLVQGKVLDNNKYGLNIKLEVDLKGNFPKNKDDTFIIWGTDDAFEYVNIELNRFDQLAKYKKGDVLIMHLILVRNLSEYTLLEKPGDYTTLTCTSSVLKLSNGRVTGYIIPEAGYNWNINQTMSWEAFKNCNNQIIN